MKSVHEGDDPSENSEGGEVLAEVKFGFSKGTQPVCTRAAGEDVGDLPRRRRPRSLKRRSRLRKERNSHTLEEK